LVANAAGDAARAASAARTSSAARAAAGQTASASLAGRGVSCNPVTVAVDTSQWHAGGSVGVTLSCTVQLADLGLPLLSGTRVISGRAAGIVDIYRQVGP